MDNTVSFKSSALISLKRLNSIRKHLITKRKPHPPVEKLKVCIIGAGPAGLATTKHFKQFHDVDTFEAREDIGGLWNYTIISELTHPDLKNDEYYKLYGNLNPSIYENMTVNLPKYLMSLKDYQASKKYSLIMKPEEYHEYLKEYADHFELHKQIKLNSLVLHVKLLRNMDEEQLLEFTPQQRKRKFAITI